MMTNMNDIQRSEYTNKLIVDHGKRFTSEQALNDLTVEMLKTMDSFNGETDAQLRKTVINLKDPDVSQVTKDQLKFKIPGLIESDIKSWDNGLDSTSSNIWHVPIADLKTWCEKRSYDFQVRYFHKITEVEEKTEDTFKISVPQKVYIDRLILISRNGILSYGDQYVISDNNTEIIIKQKIPKILNLITISTYISRKYKQTSNFQI